MKNLYTSNYRWVIASLVFFITLINFIDRSAISFVIGPLKEEFQFHDTQFGYILSAFAVGYTFMTAYGGWLVDRYGTRRIWPLAAIGWSLCLALLGFAAGFWSFVTLRFLLGVTEGPHFPAVTRSISDWLPLSERARALSLGLIAIPLSSAIGSPLISYLIADFGWRAMFFILSVFGILWALVWYWVFTDRPEDSPYASDSEKKLIAATSVKRSQKNQTPVNWHFILTHPVLITNNVAYFAFGYMLFFATLWLPGYFLEQHNLNLKSVGWYLTIPWLVGALFLKAGGILSDRLYQKTKSNRLSRSHLIWISQLTAAICFICLGLTQTLGLSIFFLSLGLGFGLMPQPAFFSVNIDVAKEQSGTAQGLTSGCLSLAGIIAPAITGKLVDLTGSFQIAFFLLAGITLIAVISVILFHHPDRA